MGRYSKIDRRIWNDSAFCAQKRTAKLAYFFVFSHPNQTALGAFRGTVRGLSSELGWSERTFRARFDELKEASFVVEDPVANFIGIPDYLNHHKPENPNVLKSWKTSMDLLPECDLKVQLLERLKALAEGLGEGFQKAFQEAFGEDLPKQLQEQLQEQLQGKEVLLSETPLKGVMDFPLEGGAVWSLGAGKVAEWKETHPFLNVLSELKRARQWLRDNPSKQKTTRGMPRFLGSWLRNAESDRAKAQLPPGTDETRSNELAEIQAKAAAGGSL